MNYFLKLVTVLVLLLPNFVWGKNECVALKEYTNEDVFPNSVDTITYCEFIQQIENFRSDFIKKYGKGNWEKYKYSKKTESEYGGVGLTIYDISIHKIFDTLTALNKVKNIIPTGIKTIEVDNEYKFTRTPNGWLYSGPIFNIGYPTKNEIIKYGKIISEAKSKIVNQPSPYLLMKIIHNNITDPITYGKLGK